jgi:putative acetyltransferase
MIEIKPIQPDQVAEVKRVILTVCHEIWQFPLEVIRCYDAMSGLDDLKSHYFNNNGTFLVLIDNGMIVGSGAIRRLCDHSCELKRIWFLKDYRGKGLGLEMAQMLLDFAKKTGYKKVRLDTVDELKQAQTLKLYKRLGFSLIEGYNDGFSTVFMEKML